MAKEIVYHKNYLNGEKIETIYLGGGTPSLLTADEINQLLATIRCYHQVTDDAEITLEANPDDLNDVYIQSLTTTAINRFSIGIQSFFDEDLIFMNRAHNAKEAKAALTLVQSCGFKDISIDLIYGAHTTTDEMWQKNLDIAFALDIPHISSYCLTVEKGTALGHFVQSGKVSPLDDHKAARQFDMLVHAAKKHHFEHYEISNFAKGNRYSKHNTAYWQGKKYLGIGPSAHSFDGECRQWNISHNAKYIEFILKEGCPFFEIEQLSAADRYNEYVMTTLRTQWGCNIEKINPSFRTYFIDKSKRFIQNQQMMIQHDRYILTDKGKFLADGIAADLFWV